MNLEEYGITEEELKNYEVPEEKIEQQIKMFKKGFPYAKLVKAATLGDGIFRIPEEKYENFLLLHKIAAKKGKYSKFVPASGAASRMFKSLNSIYSEYNDINIDLLNKKAEEDNNAKDTLKFLNNLHKFAFFENLKKAISDSGESYEELKKKGEFGKILEYILTDKGLNLAEMPKGLIEFHKYPEGTRTPFEEHIYEAIEYVKDENNKIRLHFTIPNEHDDLIRRHVRNTVKAINEDIDFDIHFSHQKKSTDTLAVTPDNEPFRLEDGNLLFRPGGHGALIENLNDWEADVVFIKNIDNVVPDSMKEDTYLYKKLLAGYLEDVQQHTFEYIKGLQNENIDLGYVLEAAGFCKNMFSVSMPPSFRNMKLAEKAEYIRNKLNRPIRICGMVKNEGEPGGGPFWVKQKDGSISLQIIEKAQINTDDEDQKDILNNSTHFNPVDLVCSLKDHKGDSFDLMKFIDKNTGFISTKYKEGRELKALELPGLWNGAMADWNTIFVEVPISTFNPVKTVNDLLRDEHQ